MLQKMTLSYNFPFVRIILDMTYSFPALLFQTQLPLLSIKMHNLENTLVKKNKKNTCLLLHLNMNHWKSHKTSYKQQYNIKHGIELNLQNGGAKVSRTATYRKCES